MQHAPIAVPDDPLSKALATVRLHGVGLERCTSLGEESATSTTRRSLYVVESGQVELRVGADEPILLTTGGLALLPQHVSHTCSPTGPATWLRGYFDTDAAGASHLFSGLPEAIVIDGAEDPDREWLGAALHFLTIELSSPLPGSQAMVSRLLDVVFIRSLRSWAARGDAPTGWLAGAMDAELAPALTALHSDLARRWTVSQLAAIAFMARSTFAERFARLVGQSPGNYLIEARLAQAADLLSATTKPLAAIAESVGYASDATFSRAFARAYGTTPSSYRSNHA